jgi:dihydroorotase
MTKRITLRRPDDWHLHVRDGAVLEAILPFTAKNFERAIIMPNLTPPIVRHQDASSYKARIKSVATAVGQPNFDPLMTLYLTETSDPQNIREGFEGGIITAAKLYPAGATTNSDAGVQDIEKIYPVLETLQELGMPLLVHGEVVDSAIDIFDREAVFIERTLIKLVERFPDLPIVFEHVTSAEGIDFVASASKKVAATITPHHLAINRNAMLVGGMRPHYYCLPVAKRESHRAALVNAAVSGSPKFFLGTDSAPHTIDTKESACGCAGIFNVPVALSVLAHIFEAAGALDKLEAFCSVNGAVFYGLKLNKGSLTLVKSDTPVRFNDRVCTKNGEIRVFDPMFDLYWSLEE